MTKTIIDRTHFSNVDSTQTYFKKNATRLLENSTFAVVTADEQTQGRGTANRMWASPPEVNIYATFGVKIPNELATYFDLINSPAAMIIMALAVAKTLEEFGLQPTIKWRNDVLLNGKKVCGILCEPLITASGGVGLIGIGLNVNMAREICDSLAQPVTSMAVEAEQIFDKERVFACLAKNVSFYIELYKAGKFNRCVPEINARLAFVGQLIHIENQFTQHVIEGICLGIDETGSLKIKCADNTIQLVRWGSIIKDELTYPEIQIKKQKVSADVKNKDQQPLVYLAGLACSAGSLLYLFYKANSDHSVIIRTSKFFDLKQQHKAYANKNKQVNNRRNFSTLFSANSRAAPTSIKSKQYPLSSFNNTRSVNLFTTSNIVSKMKNYSLANLASNLAKLLRR